jgi:MscS family membrane protein
MILFLFFWIQQSIASTIECQTPLDVISSILDVPVSTSDLGKCVGSESEVQNQKLATQLKQILDAKGIFIDYENISDDPNHKNESGEAKQKITAKLPQILIVKHPNKTWSLSTETQKVIPQLHEKTFSFLVSHLQSWIPNGSIFDIQFWQYTLFGIFTILGFLVGRVCDRFFVFQIKKFNERQKINIRLEVLSKMRRPLVALAIGLVLMIGTPQMMLSIQPSLALHFIYKTIISLSVIFLLSSMIDIICDIFTKKAENTESKLDDQLIPLIRRATKLVLWLFGGIFVLQNLNIEVTALLAFSSVSGVAIALASKDTVENLFGSIMVFVDQPFQIGDWVIIDGSIEGVVEEVGFRSTRIRSFAHSLISVPNAKIAHCTVDNFGKRKYRRFKTMIGLRYDTTTTQMETYIERVREYLQQNPEIWNDGIYIYFRNLGAHSLDIMVYTFFEVPDWRAELAAREQCLLQFMRIAEEVGVGFAFPTTTIEVEQPEGQGFTLLK